MAVRNGSLMLCSMQGWMKDEGTRAFFSSNSPGTPQVIDNRRLLRQDLDESRLGFFHPTLLHGRQLTK
jgi:hypothetical protein